MEAGILESYEELRLSSSHESSACLRYEGTETMSKQRKPARKRVRKKWVRYTYKGGGVGKEKMTKKDLSFHSSLSPCLVFFWV